MMEDWMLEEEETESVQSRLDRFVNSERTNRGWSIRSTWVVDDHMKAYVRQSIRKLPGDEERSNVLDIASIEVFAGERGKGHWRNFITFAEDLVEKRGDIKGIYIELVHNKVFADKIFKHGYQRIVDDAGVPSFLKVLGEYDPRKFLEEQIVSTMEHEDSKCTSSGD